MCICGMGRRSHWRHSQLVTGKLGRRITLVTQFILLGVPECEMEVHLAEVEWWRVWRAWTLHQMWTA